LVGGISVKNIFGLSDNVKNGFQMTVGIKSALCHAAKCLNGAKCRIFMAQTVLSLGKGGQRLAENELNWNRGTIRKGMHELQSGITCVDYYSGRGRKAIEIKPLPAKSR
jgi:hypothetical protein